MEKSIPDESKAVFAITEDRGTVIIGLSSAAWDYMKNGMTHTFDLRSLGIDTRIILFGGKTRKDVQTMLATDDNTLDMTGVDFGFGGE